MARQPARVYVALTSVKEEITLRGRDAESAALDRLLDAARSGQSGGTLSLAFRHGEHTLDLGEAYP